MAAGSGCIFDGEYLGTMNVWVGLGERRVAWVGWALQASVVVFGQSGTVLVGCGECCSGIPGLYVLDV